MKFLSITKLLCCFLLSSQMMFADNLVAKSGKSHSNRAYARAIHGTPGTSPTYTINPPNFPQTTRVSKHRDQGFKRGSAVLNSKGVTVLSTGDYWVDFMVALENNQQVNDPINTIVLLVQNNSFSEKTLSNLDSVLAGAAFFPPMSNQSVSIARSSGIIKNIKKGTRLSIVATRPNGNPYSLTVSEWEISLSKLPVSK